jgi:serine/threonine protein kinase
MSIQNVTPERYLPGTGDVIGKHRVLSVLGEGSFGVVYKVSEEGNGNIFALKLLKLWSIPYEKERDALQRRFNLEFETGRIKSDYLVHTEGSGMVKGNPYILMDYLPNGDLRPRMKKQMPVDEIERYSIGILKGLHDLHANGKVHRDLKPENVLLDTNMNPHLTDFGIAGHKNIRMTEFDLFGKPKARFGTYAYMPPEQIQPKSKHVTILPTTDIFSYGVLVYEMFARKLPFGSLETETDLAAYVFKVNQGKWENLLTVRKEVPGGWVQIVEKCLQPDYRNRFQSVKEILALTGTHMPKVKEATPVTGHLLLKVMQGEEHGKTYDLTEMAGTMEAAVIEIGRKERDTTNKIAIKEENTSYITRRHATIEYYGEPDHRWYLRHGQWSVAERRWNNSLNGTYVNGKLLERTQRHELRAGDIITTGDTTLKIVVF